MSSITSDEGTWMSLDVSPDGTQIGFFDMLGDIYNHAHQLVQRLPR